MRYFRTSLSGTFYNNTRLLNTWRDIGMWCVGSILYFCMTTASAVSISASFTPLGSNTYRADYLFINDGVDAVELVDILFDTALFDEDSLSIVSSATIEAGWDEAILASAPSVPAAYDVFALAGGVGAGESLSGFAVEFMWLGAGSAQLPTQPFEVYDPVSFELIGTGLTTLTAPVPLPAALWLFLGAIVATKKMGSKGRRAKASP